MSAPKYSAVDVGDPNDSESAWCDDAFAFTYRGAWPSHCTTFRQWFEAQTLPDDPMPAAYSRAPFVFAARFARRVENAGDVSATTFAEAMRATDQSPDVGGLTGFQMGIVHSVLGQCWTHADAFEAWFSRWSRGEGED